MSKTQPTTEAWFKKYSFDTIRLWDELYRDCPYTVMRIVAIPFQIHEIPEIDFVKWLHVHSETGEDISIIIESYAPMNRDIKYVSHIQRIYATNPKIAGIIFESESLAAMFKLAYPNLIIS